MENGSFARASFVPQDLSQHETVIYAQRAGGTTWTFHKDVSEVGVTVRGRVRVSAAEGVREAVFAELA
jgi:hypothetical protein